MKVDVNINLVGASTSVDVAELSTKLDQILAIQEEMRTEVGRLQKMKTDLDLTTQNLLDAEEASKQ